MYGKPQKEFEQLLGRITSLPVIDTHEHMVGPGLSTQIEEPITMLTLDYLLNDIISSGIDTETIEMIQDHEVSTETKWPVFEPIWKEVELTANARITKLIMEDCFQEKEMSLDALKRIAEQLPDIQDETSYWKSLDDARIQSIISDPLGRPQCDFGDYLSGYLRFPERFKIVISLPLFHVVSHHPQSGRDWEGIQRIGRWGNMHITSLDEFQKCVFDVFSIAKQRGAIGFKDQCAYNRSLDYSVVSKHEAEKIFNRLLSDPHTVFGWPEAKPLDDYLFHQYMRFARDLELPVQVHTGHIARNFDSVDRANVALFRRVLELHQEVQFDLFHGNWPYIDDMLFILKNYPNAAMNCCWLYTIDPVFAEQILVRATLTSPSSKVHGFGGDYGNRIFGDLPIYSVAHLKLARHVITSSLYRLIQMGWIDEEKAVGLAADWLFNNPNKFFNLGLKPISADDYA
jgi:hypothetical protein